VAASGNRLPLQRHKFAHEDAGTQEIETIHGTDPADKSSITWHE
jgi:hypothetical protein